MPYISGHDFRTERVTEPKYPGVIIQTEVFHLIESNYKDILIFLYLQIARFLKIELSHSGLPSPSGVTLTFI